MSENEVMTIQELAAYLQMGMSKLYHLAKAGEIPAVKIGRTWRFRKDLVDTWFDELAARNVTRIEPSNNEAPKRQPK